MKFNSRYEEASRKRDETLPFDWEVYAVECLPRTASVATHLRVVGAVPRLLRTGKNKGHKTWREGVFRREFVFDVKEFEKSEVV